MRLGLLPENIRDWSGQKQQAGTFPGDGEGRLRDSTVDCLENVAIEFISGATFIGFPRVAVQTDSGLRLLGLCFR